MVEYRTWQVALEYPKEYAAIVPICGGESPLICLLWSVSEIFPSSPFMTVEMM